MVMEAGIIIISIFAEDIEATIDSAVKFNLDFDDAYQYVSAEKYGLTLVSFDSDFDRTERGKITPAEILAG